MKNSKNYFEQVYKEYVLSLNERYDENVGMLVKYIDTRGYHTNLHGNVHPTYDSMQYAVALLNLEGYEDRALRIINNILSLQDVKPSSKTYGLWPYYMEQPIEEMMSPDYNWADFIGKLLLQAIFDQGNKITPLKSEMIEALRLAAYCVKKRNAGADYTNISVMGSFVTLAAGELLGDSVLLEYAENRLEKSVRYNKTSGGFNEYNSPHYIMVVLSAIGSMLKYFVSEKGRRYANELNELAWSSLANHYHAGTNQIAGPHSRSYADFSSNTLLSMIDAGTDGNFNIAKKYEIGIDLDVGQVPIICPDKFKNQFSGFQKAEFLSDIYYRPNDIISDDETRVLMRNPNMPELRADTYLAEKYCLGCFSKMDLWAQRRSLLAYWGTGDNLKYLRLRCLHDDYDYSSAIMYASQKENIIAGMIGFATDHGDFHFILDPLNNATINANRLVVRFEIGGDTENITVTRQSDVCFLIADKNNAVEIAINFGFCVFDGKEVALEYGNECGKLYIDAVLYKGDKKPIDFNAIKQAAVSFSLGINCETNIMPQCNIIEDRLTVDVASKCFVSAPIYPCKYIDCLNNSEVV